MADTTDKLPAEPPSVQDYLAAAVQQFSHVAWQKLGMQPDHLSGKYEKNVGEAKIAIDAAAALAKLLEPYLDEPDQRQIQSLIRDLRINFVQKSGEG